MYLDILFDIQLILSLSLSLQILALGLEMSAQRFIWVVESPHEKSTNATYFSVHSLCCTQKKNPAYSGVHKKCHYRYPIVVFFKNTTIGLSIATF